MSSERRLFYRVFDSPVGCFPVPPDEPDDLKTSEVYRSSKNFAAARFFDDVNRIDETIIGFNLVSILPPPISR
jgi:hypothetical protein